MEITIDKETLIARIILNTKRVKRQDSITQVAKDIKSLKSQLGDLKKVSELVGISTHMLNQFLSVFNLCEEVYKYVSNRIIDSVSAVYYLGKHNELDQEKLAKAYIDKKINTQDIRAIGPLRTQYPQKDIEELIELTLNSKNKKVSVIYFPIQRSNMKSVKKILVDLMGIENIVSFQKKGFLGILKITEKGEKILRNHASKKKLDLKEFLITQIKT